MPICICRDLLSNLKLYNALRNVNSMALYFPSSLKLQCLGVPLWLLSAVIFPTLLLCQTPFWVLSLSFMPRFPPGHRGLDTVHSCYLLLAESPDWSGLFWFALFYQNTLDRFVLQSTWYQYPHPGQSNYHRSLVLKTFSLSPLPIPTSHLSLFCVFNLDKLNFLLPSYSSPKPLLSFRESVSTSQSSTSLVRFDYKIWHVFSLHCLMICFQGLALPMWCIHFIMKCHSAAVIKNHSTANPMHI